VRLLRERAACGLAWSRARPRAVSHRRASRAPRRARGYEHFRDRRPPWQRPWQQLPPRQAQVVVLVAGGAAVAWYVSRQEVPYTHRRHAVFVSTALEQRIGESQFQQVGRRAAGPRARPLTRH